MPGSKGRPKSLILDLYGAYIRRLGGWMAVSNLITLMGQLGVDEQAVRSAVSRMTRRGLLVQETLAGVRGYRLSNEALRVVTEGDRRIFSTIQPARLEDGWIVVAFSVPEDARDRRQVLRSRLPWMGFGLVANGVWMARAFVDYTSVLDRWRRFPYLDPGLPAELLPAGWEGRAAADLFFELRERLELPAVRHVEGLAAPGAQVGGMATDLETAGLP